EVEAVADQQHARAALSLGEHGRVDAFEDLAERVHLDGAELRAEHVAEDALLRRCDALPEGAPLRTLQRLVVELLQLLTDVELLVERGAGVEAERQVVDQGTLLGLEHELDTALGDHLRRSLPLGHDAEEVLRQALAAGDERARDSRHGGAPHPGDGRRASPLTDVADVARWAGKRGHSLQSYETGSGRGMWRRGPLDPRVQGPPPALYHRGRCTRRFETKSRPARSSRLPWPSRAAGARSAAPSCCSGSPAC